MERVNDYLIRMNLTFVAGISFPILILHMHACEALVCYFCSVVDVPCDDKTLRGCPDRTTHCFTETVDGEVILKDCSSNHPITARGESCFTTNSSKRSVCVKHCNTEKCNGPSRDLILSSASSRATYSLGLAHLVVMIHLFN